MPPTQRSSADTSAVDPANLTHRACEQLAESHPELSAKSTFSRFGTAVFLVCSGGVLAAALNSTAAFFLTLSAVNGFYLLTLLYRALLCHVGIRWQPSAPDLNVLPPDDALPVVTLLVPLYREAASLPHLLTHLQALDYPEEKLDVKWVMEADDRETIAAAEALVLPAWIECIHVPPSSPRTKPKACNYALAFARGEIVGIYDAEDRPDPMQLRQAAARFEETGAACVQARLNFYNREESLLCRLFSLEYGIWFHYMLPGLAALGIPIPLGGTSNFIRRDRLEEMGGWDPYNVTEDADLGIRLARAGHRTALLPSTTLEEAPLGARAWMKQRTRWIKGYMQTYLVHMRQPLVLWRRLGAVGFIGFQLFVGAPGAVFLLAPVMWTLSALWASGALTGWFPLYIPGWLGGFAILNLLAGWAVQFIWALMLVRAQGWRRMAWALFCFPWYWVLHSAASVRALWQLIVAPHYWDKTTHGVSRMVGGHSYSRLL